VGEGRVKCGTDHGELEGGSVSERVGWEVRALDSVIEM
jgi:hypothetical protein